MANIFIYSGLCIMILGSLYGIYVAIKGFRSRLGNGSEKQNMLSFFQFGPVSQEMKKLITIWGVIMLAGLIITCVGLAIGLK